MKIRNESVSEANGYGTWQRVRESDMSQPSSGDDSYSREQMIAEAAYFRAEQRSFAPGNEMSDWLLAETDVDGWST